MRTNNYASACDVCGAAVLAKAGALVGPPWRVKCLPCSGEVANAPVTIKVTRVETGEILFTPSQYLNDRFDAFRGALKANGGTFDVASKTNRAKINKALACIDGLEKVGFILQIHPEVSATLQAVIHQHKSHIADANLRASKIDEALQERGLALYPFQKIGVEWLASFHAAILADDMGLGKTIQSLVAIPDKAPVLVIGPLSSAGVWASEVKTWRPELTFRSVERKDFRWPQAGEMLFCSYGSLPHLEDFARLGKMPEGVVLLADEAHKLSHPKTQRTQRFRQISSMVREALGRVWLLSGSPILNSPPELWAILQAAGLGNEAFGSYDRFCVLFDASTDSWGKRTWGTPSPQVATCLRRVMLRREKREVLTDLPAKSYRTLTVSIGSEWDKELEKCISQLKKHVPSIYDWLRAGPNVYDVDAPTPGQKGPDPVVNSKTIEAARKGLLASSGRTFEQLSHMRELLAKAKIPAMINIVEEFEEQNEPVLVFSAHRAPIDTLGQREGWAVITGDVPGEERQRIATEFQAGKYKGVALTIEAGGTALTLTRAAQVLWVTQSFTPKLNDQAEDRAARIGQTRGVVVTTLVADHYLDRRLAEIVADKVQIIEASIDAASIGSEERPETALPRGMVEVDFASIEAATKEKLQGVDAAKQEAERIAAERAQKAVELRAALEKEAEEKKAKEKTKRNYERALCRAKAKGWVVDAGNPERRIALSEAEKWAAEGLATLSGLDPDRAMMRNDMGFSRSDGYIGHWLSKEIPMGLTPNQWKIAIRLCLPYHRQIGACPQETTNDQPEPCNHPSC